VAYAAEYEGALADHLPMSLSALARMGASVERRAMFARTYAAAKGLRQLDEFDPEFLARASVRARIAAVGRAVVLREQLQTLARGIGAGAFHALIRVAYGIVDADDAEIAAGLTYWGRAALDLGEAKRLPDDRPFIAPHAFERARTMLEHVPSSLPANGLISQRMAAVAADPAFDAAVGQPRFAAPDGIAAIAALTVRAFAATRSFTLLHAMTATHALRIVLPFAADADALLLYFWRAYVAAYVSAGAPALPHEATFAAGLQHLPAWNDVLAFACASQDKHVVKAAFTAWSEDAVYHDPLYRLAAARYLRLADQRER